MSKLATLRELASVDGAYKAFNGLYRTGLLSWMNGLRALHKKPPVEYPAVGASPQEVVWERGPARLIRYGGEGERTAPVLIVPSLINKHYVLDLLPERSVVGKLRKAGLDVYCLDWGSAQQQDVHSGLAHYALRLLPEAASHVHNGPAHILGYCMGGTLALGAIATGRLQARSLVAMATPVDCDHGGILTTWSRTETLKPNDLVTAFGNVPAYILQPAFKMMDPMGMVSKFLHAQQKIEDDDFCRFFLAMETWLEDNVPFPGKAFQEWIGDIYQKNAVMKGAWELDGNRVNLKNVTCPVLSITAEEDYICPPKASAPLMTALGTRDVENIVQKGGHIGLSTGSGAHKHLWPKVAEWMLARSTVTTEKPKATPVKKASRTTRRRASA